MNRLAGDAYVDIVVRAPADQVLAAIICPAQRDRMRAMLASGDPQARATAEAMAEIIAAAQRRYGRHG